MVLKDGKNYKNEAKEYVINMTSNACTLHKKNGCYYSHYLSNYYDFDALEEAEQSDVEFLKCKICFGEVER